MSTAKNSTETKVESSVRRFKPYPRYKNSGVEWIGEVPADWSAERLRFYAEVNPVKSEVRDLDGDTLVSFVPMEAIGEDGSLRLDQTKAIDEVSTGYTYFRDGDVIVAKITPCFENGKGAIAKGLENGIGFGTTELHVIRPGKVLNREYLFYLLMSHAFRSFGAATMYGAGGQKRVPEDFIQDFKHSIPPIDYQKTISAFLDRETARIDQLIARKERQIELLQEKRSALISHAVTKGLNPNVKMKDSGIEWLGEIPEHWYLMRFKYLLSEPLKYGANEVAELDDPSLPRYVRITDVNEDGTLRDDTFKSLPEDIAKPYLLKDGDLLFARSGATVGKTFYYQESWGRTAYAGYLIRGRLAPERMISKFAAYFAQSINYWGWLRSSIIQATIQNVSAEKYAGLVLGIPSMEEQMQIASFLDRETACIDNLNQKIRDSIEKLCEYRTALIYAAVTGKIDVRKEAS